MGGDVDDIELSIFRKLGGTSIHRFGVVIATIRTFYGFSLRFLSRKVIDCSAVYRPPIPDL
jgi:hypothetical protein